jgi:hypothetical protein
MVQFFGSSDIMQCVHPTQRTVLNRALASQSSWVLCILYQFCSIIWLLSVCIGITAFNFVSSLLMYYAQLNTRLRSFLRVGLSTKHPSMGWSIFQTIHFFWKKMRLEFFWICLVRQVCDNWCMYCIDVTGTFCRIWKYRCHTPISFHSLTNGEFDWD